MVVHTQQGKWQYVRIALSTFVFRHYDHVRIFEDFVVVFIVLVHQDVVFDGCVVQIFV